MKAVVSVFGRYHAFELARELGKRGCLQRLHTSYPTFEAVKNGVSRARVTSAPWLEAMARAFRKAKRIHSDPLLSSLFDKWSASRLKEGPDLFVGWSGSTLLSLRRAKQLGMTTIVERGSTHMLHQTKVLTEEYARFGLFFRGTPKGIIERELKEYDEADGISVPSAQVARTFLDHGVPESKLIQIPYGTDLKLFRRGPRVDPKFRILFVGALTLRKGLPYLIRAFTELALPKAELCLVGSLSSEIAKLFARELGSPNIVLHGPKPQRLLPRFYQQSDVFCLPSLEEGLAMVIPQAMACGLPVIATASSGAGDIVREGIEGFLVGCRDVEALKEKLQWCYDNRRLCEAMGAAAEARAVESFSWDDYGNRVHHAYHACLG